MNIYDDLKYPVKYALLPIEEQVGWQSGLYELERDYDICGYIVSKAYLVGKREEYLSDGQVQVYYQLVFPYDDIDETNQRKIPVYDFINSQYRNVFETQQVYEDYETAKEKAFIRNELIRRNYINPIMFDRTEWPEIIKKKTTKYERMLARYHEFENNLQKLTEDMIITKETQKTLIRKPYNN